VNFNLKSLNAGVPQGCGRATEAAKRPGERRHALTLTVAITRRPGGTVKLRRSSQNTGGRTVVIPRSSRCAIAPPLLIGRSEASTGRRDGAGG
jgi:hypothetical protein